MAIQIPLSKMLLENFIASFHQLHSILPDNFPAFQLSAWFHWFNFEAYLSEIRELAARYTPWLVKQIPEGRSLADRLGYLIESCSAYIKNLRFRPNEIISPIEEILIFPGDDLIVNRTKFLINHKDNRLVYSELQL